MLSFDMYRTADAAYGVWAELVNTAWGGDGYSGNAGNHQEYSILHGYESNYAAGKWVRVNIMLDQFFRERQRVPYETAHQINLVFATGPGLGIYIDNLAVKTVPGYKYEISPDYGFETVVDATSGTQSYPTYASCFIGKAGAANTVNEAAYTNGNVNPAAYETTMGDQMMYFGRNAGNVAKPIMIFNIGDPVLGNKYIGNGRLILEMDMWASTKPFGMWITASIGNAEDTAYLTDNGQYSIYHTSEATGAAQPISTGKWQKLYIDLTPYLTSRYGEDAVKIHKINLYARTGWASFFLDNVRIRYFDGAADTANLISDGGYELKVDATAPQIHYGTHPDALPVGSYVNYVVKGGTDNTVTATEDDNFIDTKSGEQMLYAPHGHYGALSVKYPAGTATDGLTLEFDVYRVSGGAFGVWAGAVIGSAESYVGGDENAVYHTSSQEHVNYVGVKGEVPVGQWHHMVINLEDIYNARYGTTVSDITETRLVWRTASSEALYFDNFSLTKNATKIDVLTPDNNVAMTLPQTEKDLVVRAANYSGVAATGIVAIYTTGASGKQVLESATPFEVADAGKAFAEIQGAKAADGKTVKVFLWSDKTPLANNITLK